MTPLEGLSVLASGPAQLSPHAVVVLETFSGSDERQRVFAFDFLPREPKRLSTALALFSGGAVEAIGRERRLARVPRRRCVLVGEGRGGGRGRGGGEEKEANSSSNGSDGSGGVEKTTTSLLLAAARAKLSRWEKTPLVWLRYDCTHAAVELAAQLAGVEEGAARRALERACSS